MRKRKSFHVNVCFDEGIWGKGEDGPMHTSSDTLQGEHPLVAAGGIDGQIRLFRYPCGHSEVRWNVTGVS